MVSRLTSFLKRKYADGQHHYGHQREFAADDDDSVDYDVVGEVDADIFGPCSSACIVVGRVPHSS